MQRITVTAPARLHMGFLDLNGGLGRHFGSLGLAIDGIATAVSAEPAARFEVAGPESARVARCARQLLAAHGLSDRVRLCVERAIPSHVGLGSGTQLALATGVALTRLFAVPLSVRAIACGVRRGARSGIGIGAFEAGGFLVDGGKGTAAEPPHIVARAEFPPEWRVLLIFDPRAEGIHGAHERAAFEHLPPFPAASAGELCRVVLMQALPALLEADITAFGRAVGIVQKVIGDHFASAQGGRYLSPAVAAALTWLESEGIAGVGQSSWGPTGFAVVGAQADADRLLRAARARWGDRLRFLVCRGLNRGGEIKVSGSAARPAAIDA